VSYHSDIIRTAIEDGVHGRAGWTRGGQALRGGRASCLEGPSSTERSIAATAAARPGISGGRRREYE